MGNLTHSERLAIALAMRDACVAKLMESAPSKENDGYRASNDPVRGLAASVAALDPMEVLVALEGRAAVPETEHTAFEQAAALQFFNTQRRDNGEYFHPITVRAWKLWQMANNFKEDRTMNTMKEVIDELTQDAVKPDSAAIADAMIAEAVIPAPDTRPVITVELEEVPELAPIAHDAPPTLKLGEMSSRLLFTVTADFLLSLGFAPAATEKNSKLFHESQFQSICAAIQRHVAAVQAKF